MKRATPSAPSQRMLRVAELIRHSVSELLARGDVMDPELAGLSITVPEVRMSPDLKHATVFIEPLGGGSPQKAVVALERNAKWMRGQVAKKINLKFAPDLRFRHDTRFEETAKIDALLRSAVVARDVAGDDE
jgi:ribosome-binding factor A